MDQRHHGQDIARSFLFAIYNYSALRDDVYTGAAYVPLGIGPLSNSEIEGLLQDLA